MMGKFPKSEVLKQSELDEATGQIDIKLGRPAREFGQLATPWAH
jgi:hypothetical protein